MFHHTFLCWVVLLRLGQKTDFSALVVQYQKKSMVKTFSIIEIEGMIAGRRQNLMTESLQLLDVLWLNFRVLFMKNTSESVVYGHMWMKAERCQLCLLECGFFYLVFFTNQRVFSNFLSRLLMIYCCCSRICCIWCSASLWWLQLFITQLFF